METQHDLIAELLEQAMAALTHWRLTATSAEAAVLAAVLTRLVAALNEHLDAEESHLLPIMARHITEPEWAEFTARGMESIPRKQTLLGFGMMLYEGDAEVIAILLRDVPAPVRAILPTLGKNSFRRYAMRIHGTRTPPRGTDLAVR